jgi:mRNA-degrading endonuclease toxin of MazEF toxin-antitoxin module
MVNLTRILTVDTSRLQRRIGTLSQELIEKVNAAIKISLDVG